MTFLISISFFFYFKFINSSIFKRLLWFIHRVNGQVPQFHCRYMLWWSWWWLGGKEERRLGRFFSRFSLSPSIDQLFPGIMRSEPISSASIGNHSASRVENCICVEQTHPSTRGNYPSPQPFLSRNSQISAPWIYTMRWLCAV